MLGGMAGRLSHPRMALGVTSVLSFTWSFPKPSVLRGITSGEAAKRAKLPLNSEKGVSG